MRHTGKITSWNAQRGFGFIRPDDGTADVFVHIRDFANRSRQPEAGDPVNYMITREKRSGPRMQAVSVRFGDEAALSVRSVVLAGIICMYAVAQGTLAYTARLPGYFFPMIVLLNLVTYLVYWRDKRAAERRAWRTPEIRLHILALLGGWPGALIAQGRLRHKTQKTSFRMAFFLTAILNITAIGYLALQDDSSALDRFAEFIAANAGR